MVLGVSNFLKYGKNLGQFYFFRGLSKISRASRDDFIFVPLDGFCQTIQLCNACLPVKTGPPGKLSPHLGVKCGPDGIRVGCVGRK